MAVKRKVSNKLATKALCFLRYVGNADARIIGRRFGQSEGSVQRVLDRLESRELISLSRLSPGRYHVRERGHSAIYGGRRDCGRYLAPSEMRR